MIDMMIGPPRPGKTPPKTRELTVSDMIHKNSISSASPVPGELRDYLVKRTMEKHSFTREQALALILAFGG